jgi:hypothetical protein
MWNDLYNSESKKGGTNDEERKNSSGDSKAMFPEKTDDAPVNRHSLGLKSGEERGMITFLKSGVCNFIPYKMSTTGDADGIAWRSRIE